MTITSRVCREVFFFASLPVENHRVCHFSNARSCGIIRRMGLAKFATVALVALAALAPAATVLQGDQATRERLAQISAVAFGSRNAAAAAEALELRCGWLDWLWWGCEVETPVVTPPPESEPPEVVEVVSTGVPAEYAVTEHVIERIVVREEPADQSALLSLLERVGLLEAEIGDFEGSYQPARDYSPKSAARSRERERERTDESIVTAISSGSSDASLNSLAVSGGATSTFANGLDIDEGCYAINGVCVGAGIVSSQWDSVPGGLSYVGGNVGIGTTSPSVAFVVTGESHLATTTISGGLTVIGNTTITQGGQLTVGDKIIAPGEIGLGTTSPSAKLAIQSTDPSQTAFLLQSTPGQVNPLIDVFGNSNTSFFRLTAGGHVGIGTSTPTQALAVQGDAHVSGTMTVGALNSSGVLSVGGNLRLVSSGTDSNRLVFGNSVGEDSIRLRGYGGERGWVFTVGGSDAYYFNQDGGFQAAEVSANEGTFGQLTVSGGTALNVNESGGLARIKFQNPSAADTWYLGTRSSTGDNFNFETGAGQLLSITTAGSVGIGTTTPSQRLTVAGNQNLTGYLSFDDNIDIRPAGLSTGGYGNTLIGIGNSVANSTASVAVGSGNTVNGFLSFAFGRGNTIGATSYSGAYGLNNSVGQSNAFAFGQGITNNTLNSVMIGPSDTAKMTILSSGNVGIGTATPGAKLDVAGGAATTAVSGLRVSQTWNSSGTTFPGALVVDVTNTASADQSKLVDVSYNGTSAFSVLRDATWGNTFSLPGHGSIGGVNFLFGQISGVGKLDGASGAYRILDTGDGSGAIQLAQSTPVTWGAPYYAPDTGLSRSAAGVLKVTDGASGLGTLVVGNIGIGTTSPFAKLSVVGSGYFDGNVNATGPLSVRSSSEGSTNYTIYSQNSTYDRKIGFVWDAGGASAGINTDSGLSLYAGSGITLSPSAGATYVNSNLGVYAHGGVGSPASRLSVNGNAAIGSSYFQTAAPTNGLIVEGNVGIGSTTPGAKLTVVTANGTATNQQFSIGNGNGSDYYIGRDGVTNGHLVFSGGLAGQAGYDFNGPVTSNGATLISQGVPGLMVGNVGGLAAPAQGIRIAGSADGTFDYTIARESNATGNLQFVGTNAGQTAYVFFNGASEIFRVAGSGSVYSATLGGGATNVTVDANGNLIRDPSDANLKENVEAVSSAEALEKVLTLRGVTFDWRDQEKYGPQRELGFIAQEVQAVIPEAVSDGGDYLSLSVKPIVAALVEALKAVWAVVEDLVAKVEGLATLVKTQRTETETLCVGETCITEAELQILLRDADVPESAPREDGPSDAEPEEGSDEEPLDSGEQPVSDNEADDGSGEESSGDAPPEASVGDEEESPAEVPSEGDPEPAGDGDAASEESAPADDGASGDDAPAAE
ncbi:Chaperone of endosialidase [Prosthecobacter debontii]|uniref:Chaperone of endosialidase n=1 Tax=Prosthecobacter debontii TaxID=48467 RepID=A0A1T4X9J6_9BACT|nr:tail fiber domain-containing protein [Prosthecobacter debontii]SKA85765.1 Chaperone of endosialidase [Prosthecobacter debontii]